MDRMPSLGRLCPGTTIVIIMEGSPSLRLPGASARKRTAVVWAKDIFRAIDVGVAAICADGNLAFVVHTPRLLPRGTVRNVNTCEGAGCVVIGKGMRLAARICDPACGKLLFVDALKNCRAAIVGIDHLHNAVLENEAVRRHAVVVNVETGQRSMLVERPRICLQDVQGQRDV